jgi:hypothetical protein
MDELNEHFWSLFVHRKDGTYAERGTRNGAHGRPNRVLEPPVRALPAIFCADSRANDFAA